MQLKKLCKELDELLPGNGLTDYCPNGLQVEGKQEIALLATAVSASLETIEAAVEIGADALIVHHGIFWQRDSYLIQGVKKKKLSCLLKNEISLIAYHLPLDMHPLLGNNWKAAQDLGWSDLQPFGYSSGVPVGVKGRIAPASRNVVKEKLENYYGHPAVCALGGPEVIQTLALISGGAYRNLSDAARDGVDAFITGSFDEPVWHQAFEERINFFALGHSATERVGPMALAKHLESKYQIPCTFLDFKNPF
ncbi:MAG: Nif3-like dinuclear metal center hexameric protein [Chlamydiales bacterium]